MCEDLDPFEAHNFFLFFTYVYQGRFPLTLVEDSLKGFS